MENTLLFILIAISTITLVLSIISIIISSKNKQDDTSKVVTEINSENQKQLSILRQELTASTQQSVKSMGDMISDNQKQFSQSQQEKLDTLESRMKTFSLENEQKLDLIRKSVESSPTFRRITTSSLRKCVKPLTKSCRTLLRKR